MANYDIVTVGGGLGGAALARAMAEKGARVLVLERETAFKDRVRGEGMTTWGAAEARELGIHELVRSSCGHDLPMWENYVGPMQVLQRDIAATTPQGLPTLAFYHPEMQRTVLEAAEKAGAEVRSGVRATGISPGVTPTVTVQRNGGPAETITARLIVGADGRNSPLRKWAQFEEHQNADRLFISGVLFDGSAAPDDTVRLVSDFERGRGTIIFPQGRGRVRSYMISRADEGLRLQGAADVPRFVEEAVTSGMPGEFFDGAVAAGPLATFNGADCWVEHPYREGVALMGDAAASSDPSWGQGLSLTLRDARVLRDALLANDDWDVAGHGYASEHDRYFGVVRTVEGWLTELFYDVGPAADERRGRALGLAAEDPTRQPDTMWSGPDHTVDETMRRRLFGED
ncbi:MAG: FAD-dependent monooxygenase [Chloroflexi bacterium]|nr:FAD-dependent monooxygenase [Chloroflexota bacterium]